MLKHETIFFNSLIFVIILRCTQTLIQKCGMSEVAFVSILTSLCCVSHRELFPNRSPSKTVRDSHRGRNRHLQVLYLHH